MGLTSPTENAIADPTGDSARSKATGGCAGVQSRFALLLVLAALLPITAARAEIPFSDASVPVQEGPVGINASDCNGDGLPDLIVANQISNSVTILRNRGDGTLVFSKTLAATTVTAPTPTPTGPTPAGPTPTATPNPTVDEVGVSSAVCGDFDGDTLPDVAFVNRGFNKVTIRRKEANGDFTLVSSLPVGSRPTWVSTIDLNHDDDLDLVVLNSQSDDLTILRGDGTGGFPLSSTIHIPGTGQTNRPVTAALADFNGDTHIDILVGNQSSPFHSNQSLTLLLGNGDGSFHEFGGALPVTGRVKSIATNDFNGDDIPDLAVLSGDTSIVFFTGTGNGSFQPFGALAVPANTPDIALADFDDDDAVDLALAYYKTNDVQVLFATGPAEFVTPSRFHAADQDFASSVFFNSPNAAATRASANGTQLLTFDKKTPAIDVLDFTNANTITTTAIVPLTEQPEAVVLGDFNNDALPDAVVVTKGRRGLALQILPANSLGYGPPASGLSTCGNGIPEGAELCDDGNLKNRDGCSATCAVEIGRKLFSIAAGDVNGDHNQDLVIVGASNYVLVLIGDGQGRFTQVQRLAKVRTKTPAAVGDFTGDGFLDIATIPSSSRVHGISLLVNDGTGVFTPVSLMPTLKVTGPFLTGDIDGDGLLDLVAASKTSDGGAIVLANDGTGPNVKAATLAAGKGLTALAAADFDEDGVLDVLVSSSSKTRPFSLFRGLGDGKYGAGQARFIGQKPAMATVFDTNEDVHQDVVLCDSAVVPPCRVQYGDGTGQFAAAPLVSATFIGRDLRAVAAADIDKDSTVDFVGVSRKDGTVSVLFRAGASTPEESVKLATGNKPRAVAVGDLNGDLLPDLVVANGGSDELSIFINLDNRQFQSLARVKLPKDAQGHQGDNPSAVALVDLNDDQKLDIVVSQEGSGDLARLINLGGDLGNGGLASIGTLAVGAGPVDLAVGFLNADTVPDFVVANPGLGSLSVLLSDVGGAYVSSAVSSGGLQPSGVALADLDGDLVLDLVAINQQSNSVATFLNDGAGAFTLKRVSQVRGRHNPQDLCIGDFDFDETLDVAIASPGTKDIFVLRGRGDGTWESDERVYQVGKDPVAVACTKVDGDEKTDIVFGRRGGGDIDFITTAD